MSQGFTATARMGIWLDYTPAWTSSGTQPAIGNGTLTGRYRQQGKTVQVGIDWLAGTTTTFGTGNWQFSLPVAARLPASSHFPIGSAFGENAGAQGYNGLSTVSQAEGLLYVFTPGVANAWTNVTPFTWGDTDLFRVEATYEAA